MKSTSNKIKTKARKLVIVLIILSINFLSVAQTNWRPVCAVNTGVYMPMRKGFYNMGFNFSGGGKYLSKNLDIDLLLDYKLLNYIEFSHYKLNFKRHLLGLELNNPFSGLNC